MPICFMNKSVIDLDVTRVMGVNVKEIDNPIGYFGTGLKFAIATLLRTGHKVTLYCDSALYEFTARPVEIRGKMFDLVHMNDEKLAYTTDLGRNWEVWQAFRELYSNCMDELGVVSDKIKDGPWGTMFIVQGPEMEKAYYARGQVFLQSDPLYTIGGVEIHHGTTHEVFYRGVRVYTMPKKSAFTYNLIGDVKLTEDRTAASAFDLQYQISCVLAKIQEEKSFHKLLFKSDDEFWDSELDHTNCYEPSDAFLDYVEKHLNRADMNTTAKALLKRVRPPKIGESIELTEVEKATVKDAIEMLYDKLSVRLDETKIQYVENLGPGIYAAVSDGAIRVARQTIANGKDFLMITFYEEWIHLHLGYRDHTRGMQQYLFDKILQLVKEQEE